MLKILLKFLALYFSFVLAGVIQKPIFLMLNHNASEIATSLPDWLGVIVHGLPMDFAVAAYLSVIPLLILYWQVWMPSAKLPSTILNIYFIVAVILVSTTATLNLGLYGYWRFPLDTTPLFYFTSSPKAAFASAGTGEMLAGTLFFIAFATCLYMLLRWSSRKAAESLAGPATLKSRWSTTAVLTLIAGAMVVAMRGGVTVSTMNLSRAYHSQNQFLNHAAVNPAFSLLYSASHQTDFKKQFRFFTADDATITFNRNLAKPATDSTTVALLNTARPDIVMVILESFSTHLMPSLGGEAVAVKLDSVGSEGVVFDNLYASSFRTDRALPAVLSGFPGQPNTSLMKFADKTEHIASLPRSLKENGWKTAYYYGGDINFTNMLAYLVNCGFEHIVRDTDFPIGERTGKWGAHDHLVFKRCLADLRKDDSLSTARFTVVQTSSSHEPFEVPFNSSQPDKERNAFAYADNCLGDFLDSLKSLPRYDRTLVVIVPDHYGAYPKGLADTRSRHHIPVVLTGGALAVRGLRVSTPAAQTDLAATLLAQLGIDHSDFIFSKDIFGAATPKYAFFSDPSTAAIISDSGLTVIDLATSQIDVSQSTDVSDSGAANVKTFLQNLYDTLDSL